MSDYISKEDVLKVLKQVFDKHNATDNEIAADCLQAVKNIPAADSLIKRPCNVGDTLWCDGKHFASHCAGKLHSFVVDEIATEIKSHFRGETDYCFDFDDFGKIVFSDKTKAKEVLQLEE